MDGFKLKRSQKEFFNAFLTGAYEFLLYAGPAGTGKSFGIALLAIMLANDFPDTKVVVVRKNLTTARRTIWETYKKVLRLLGITYKTNDSLMTITLNPGEKQSVIQVIEADRSKDPDWNKLKGIECSFEHIDEANEIDREALSILMTRKNRWNENGCPAPIFMTCNPSLGWIKEMFYDPWSEGKLLKPYYFCQSHKTEMPEAFRKTLELLPDKEKERYLEGLWTFSDDPNQLITFEWLKQNICEPADSGFTHISTDAARYGDDRTVISYRIGNELRKYETFTKQDTAQTAYVMEQRMNENSIGYKNAVVDVIGLGAGVVDNLRARQYFVRQFNSAESPDEDYKTVFEFKNKRAQYFWKLRERLKEGTIKLINDPDIIRELTNIRYIIKDKVIAIESKDEIKRRLGFSPDIADSIMMAFSFPEGSVNISSGENVFQQGKNSKLGWNNLYAKASRFDF